MTPAIMTPWRRSADGERHSLLIGAPRIGVSLTLGLLLATWPAAAHGPLFSAGPETPWKGAVEITAGYLLAATGNGRVTGTVVLALMAAFVELPLHAPLVVLGAPLTIDADAFKTASGDLEGSLRLICDKVHGYGDIPVGKKT